MNFCGELLPSTGLSHGVNINAAYRKGEYYQLALALSNGSGPVWQAVTNQAVKGGNTTTITNNLLCAPATQTLTYDLDGSPREIDGSRLPRNELFVGPFTVLQPRG